MELPSLAKELRKLLLLLTLVGVASKIHAHFKYDNITEPSFKKSCIRHCHDVVKIDLLCQNYAGIIETGLVYNF